MRIIRRSIVILVIWVVVLGVSLRSQRAQAQPPETTPGLGPLKPPPRR